MLAGFSIRKRIDFFVAGTRGSGDGDNGMFQYPQTDRFFCSLYSEVSAESAVAGFSIRKRVDFFVALELGTGARCSDQQ